MTWNDTKSVFGEQTDVPEDKKITATNYNNLVAFLEERQAWSQTTESADYTASDEDAVWVDASSNAVTVTLPAPETGIRVAVLAVDATNTVRVSQNASEGINDTSGSQSSLTLAVGEAVTVESDGSTWWVVASSGGGGTDTRTDVSDDGLTTVSETGDINFGTDLDVTDDGDGTATVDATGSFSGNPSDLNQDGATTGQYLEWDGSQWATTELKRNHAEAGGVALEPAGSGNDFYSIPIYLQDGWSVDWRWGSLSLPDGTNDSNIELRLVDWNENIEDSISMSSGPTIVNKQSAASLTNNAGGPRVAYLRVINTGSVNYTDSDSSTVNAVEYAGEWIIMT
jgi:hypothetical protein